MSRYRDLLAQPPDISTKAELLQRLAARAKPAPGLIPSPSPEERLEALKETEAANEQRIADLARSLDGAHRDLNHGYAYSSLKGRSQRDFERNR